MSDSPKPEDGEQQSEQPAGEAAEQENQAEGEAPAQDAGETPAATEDVPQDAGDSSQAAEDGQTEAPEAGQQEAVEGDGGQQEAEQTEDTEQAQDEAGEAAGEQQEEGVTEVEGQAEQDEKTQEPAEGDGQEEAGTQEQDAEAQEQEAGEQEQDAAAQEQDATAQEQVDAVQEQDTAAQEQGEATPDQKAAAQEQEAAAQEQEAPADSGEAQQTEADKPASAAGSKHTTPAGSRTGSAKGSKPATPAGSARGSTAGTPKAASPAGSKPGSARGSKAATPAGSKPGTPAGSKVGSAAGSKAGSAAGSKPGSAKGSKPATPAGSKPGTPSQDKPQTPAEAGAPRAPMTTPAPAEPAPSESIPPPPPPISMGTETSSTETKMSNNALNMSWSFGMNKQVPVLNLTDGSRKVVMYACAHTGVLYDFEANSQTLLQGHSNAISCSCVSEDKRWLATGDKGNDSMIIIWDTYSSIPVQTLFDAHPDGGVVAMAMSPDAKYLASLSIAQTQTLAIWDWTVDSSPICTLELDPSYGQQTYILFNPEDPTQLISNSETQVIFYTWKAGQLEHCAPPLTDEDFNKPVGKYSQSIFLSNSTRALTATSLGNLVVWDSNQASGKAGDQRALKLVKLQDRALNVITTTDNFIVTGDALGHIKFFDQTLKLMNWYQDFHLGPVNSLSFAYWPEFASEATGMSKYPPDATIAARQFVIRDYVIGTTNAVYAHVTTDGTNVDVIHRDHDAAVYALAAHPNSPRIVVGSYSGLLKIWDYQKKEVITSRWFERGQMIRCCTYDPSGTYLAVGFTNGSVRVLDGISLEDVVSEPFRYSRDAITHVAFSHDCRYLATADAEYTVTLFKAQSPKEGGPWMYVGRHRAHYKLIQDIVFGLQLDSDEPRLTSLGRDRVMVEYDLENSSTDNLVVASSDRIEQSAVPMCMTWYPPITKESFIVTANDQYKFKLYNSTTKMCRKTLLGPTYGSPLQKIVILPTEDPVHDKRYLAYITDDKIGLHILPLDGNPHNAVALIAHPQGVANLVSSYDGKHLFTAGGRDSTVHMWDININALEAQARLGGEDLVPFYGLLDGGRDGELFREMEDYFYYAQIRSQGVDTMDSRKVSTQIPLSEIPFVMRAMGFYPSEQEIEDMLNEVKFSTYVETGKYTTEIDLGDFIRLYINHRPAFGLQPEKLLWAFEVLGYQTDDGAAIERGDLLDLLQNKGEHMTEYDLAEYLTTLLGQNPEGGSSELQEFDPSTAGDIIDENLPHEITSEAFSNELLGFGMYNDILNGEQGEGVQQA